MATFTARMAKLDIPEVWKEETEIPAMKESSCTITCYRMFYKLPVRCAVNHDAELCECDEEDRILVHEYIKRLYEEEVKNPQWDGYPPSTLSFYQEIIHKLCESFDEQMEEGFPCPANIPDPRVY